MWLAWVGACLCDWRRLLVKHDEPAKAKSAVVSLHRVSTVPDEHQHCSTAGGAARS